MASLPTYRAIDLDFGQTLARTTEGGITYLASSQPLRHYPRNVGEVLEKWSRLAPDRPFLCARTSDGEWRSVNYAEALDTARRLGTALLKRDLSAERPVAILSGNDIEHGLLALACLYSGIPFAPISPSYSRGGDDFGRLLHVARTLTPGLVFASDATNFLSAIEQAFPDAEPVFSSINSTGRRYTLFDDLCSTPPSPDIDDARGQVGPDTIAKFLFTSGSTGLPQAVINTHRMLCANMQMTSQVWAFVGDEPPVLVDWLPWHHTFGGNQNFGLTLYNGGTLFIDDGAPTPAGMAKTLRNLRDVGPTIYFNVPKGWTEIVNALDADLSLRRSFFSRLKMQFYAGASLSAPVLLRLYELAETHCGERIIVNTGFGMTETAPNALGTSRNSLSSGELGGPLPGVEVKLVPTEAGPPDAFEIRYRGPNVTPGYWRAPSAAAEAFDSEGFLRSGDAVAWVDPQRPELGLKSCGRIGENFKLSTGEWVSVGPLRNRLCEHGYPYVLDVVVTGHARDEVGLLILPNVDACRSLMHGERGVSDNHLLHQLSAVHWVQQFVDWAFASGKNHAERVMRAILLTEPLSAREGEVTDKGSINQRAVLRNRAAVVESLYDGSNLAVLRPSKRREGKQQAGPSAYPARQRPPRIRG